MHAKPFLRIPALFFSAFLLLLQLHGHSQESWVSYSQKISIEKYRGKNFRLKALAGARVEDDSASARLWVRTEGIKTMPFFDNMWDRPIRDTAWKNYIITGKVDAAVTHLSFGMLCQYNGIFYFDNLEIDVEIKKGKWETIFREDFENSSHAFVQGIQIGEEGKNEQCFIASVLNNQTKPVFHYFSIQGRNVPNYGINNKVGKYAEVNGIRLYYEIYGDGPPLVVLHGNGGEINNAASFYPHLIKKYKVIALDSRGQGRSGDTEADLTYEQMASDVHALLENLHIDSAYIWGQSDGAILGLILAMNYPKKVKKVLAFGSNIVPDSSAIFNWGIEVIQKAYAKAANTKQKKLNKLMLEHPHIPYEKLSTIKAPVLIMTGDRDVIRPEHSVKLFQHIPQSQLCIIPGATHGASWEKQEIFLRFLYEFFDQPFTMPDTRSWFAEE